MRRVNPLKGHRQWSTPYPREGWRAQRQKRRRSAAKQTRAINTNRAHVISIRWQRRHAGKPAAGQRQAALVGQFLFSRLGRLAPPRNKFFLHAKHRSMTWCLRTSVHDVCPTWRNAVLKRRCGRNALQPMGIVYLLPTTLQGSTHASPSEWARVSAYPPDPGMPACNLSYQSFGASTSSGTVIVDQSNIYNSMFI